MDFLENMKLRNIFGQDARTPPTFPGGNVNWDVFSPTPPSPEFSHPSDPGAIQPMIGQDTNLDSIREEGHAALDKFLESIGHIPQREDYKPSLWRNIGAGIVGGFNGAEAGSRFRTKKYDSAVDDWKLKTNALGQAATQERTNNSAESAAHAREINAILATRRADQGDERVRQGDARIAQTDKAQAAKAKLDAWKQGHPDYDLKVNQDGHYVFFNPKNPLETPIDTGVNSGDLSDTEAINLRGQWALRAAAVPRNTITSGTTTTIDPNAPKSGELKPGEEKIRAYNSAQKLAAQEPDLAKYIKLGELGTNEFTIDPKTPPDVLDRINGSIYSRPGDIDLDNPGPKPKVTTSSRTTSSFKGNPPTAKPPSQFSKPPNKTEQTLQPGQKIPPNPRQDAIDELTKAGAPVTEANIKEAMRQLGSIK